MKNFFLASFLALACLLASCQGPGIYITEKDNVLPGASSESYADIDEASLPQEVVARLSVDGEQLDLVLAEEDAMGDLEGTEFFVLRLNPETAAELANDSVIGAGLSLVGSYFPQALPFLPLLGLLFKRVRRGVAEATPGLRGPSGKRSPQLDEAFRQLASLFTDTVVSSTPPSEPVPLASGGVVNVSAASPSDSSTFISKTTS